MISILLNTINFFIVQLADFTAKLCVSLLEVTEDFVLGEPVLTFEADEVSILAVDIQVLLLV